MKNQEHELKGITVYSEKTGKLMSISEETSEDRVYGNELSGDYESDPLVGWMHGGWQKDSSW